VFVILVNNTILKVVILHSHFLAIE
jgi:hypothetical protein